MKEMLISARNAINRFGYKCVIRPIFFCFHPETMHHWATKTGRRLRHAGFFTKILFGYTHPMLHQTIAGMTFKTPVGIPGGFDKNGVMVETLSNIFGFVEVGSITAKPYAGNPGQKLWRLKKDKSLVVYYGLMNDGVDVIRQRLRMKFSVPLFTNIAKTNCKETCDTKKGIADYVFSHKQLASVGDAAVLNISCPNAFGGEPFTDAKKLDLLLKEWSKIKTKKSTFIKLSPDLSEKEINDILAVVKKYDIAGFICSNLVKKRNIKTKSKNVPKVGGFSGKICTKRSTAQIKYIYKKTKGRYVLIGCGGIFSAEDVYDKIKAGASLVELIAGMIYEGPQLISEINQGLVRLLKRDGYKNISEAVGKFK